MTVIRLVIIAPFRLSASFLTESRDCTTARQGATTMVACSFSIARPVVVRVPSRVHRRHQHTMGEVICAWFGKIPVVKRENGDAAPHQLCYIFFMRGEWWIDESIQSTPPSRVRGPLRNTIDGYDLARFGPIQWLEWENWVVVNAEICDN